MRSCCFQVWAKIAASMFSAVLVGACAASCSSSPSIQDRAAAQQISIEAPPLTPAANAEPSSTGADSALKNKVFFNLTPTSLPPEGVAVARADDSQDASVVRDEVRAEANAAKGRAEGSSRSLKFPSIQTIPDAALIAELTERRAKEWATLSGGLGETPADGTDFRRLAVAKQIIALCFLRQDHGADDEAVAEAVRAAHLEAAGDDFRLLAAAFSAHSGSPGETEKLLEDLSLRKRLKEEPADSEAAKRDFQVTGLVFARSIEGPGKFTPAEATDLVPGKQVLVYGELRNFRSVKLEKQGSEPGSYRRAFAASLRLLSSSGEEIDRLDFLPESRGRQTAPSIVDVMNFWARYRLPADLKPGSYKLSVDAKDILGEEAAMAEMDFTLAAN